MTFLTRAIPKMKNFMIRADTPRLLQQKLPQDVRTFCDISYCAAGGQDTLFDVYTPQNMAGSLPVILDFHGGALLYGDKDLNKNYNMNLARQGFVVVSFSYPLVPAVTLIQQVKTLYLGVQTVVARLAEWGGDPKKVCLNGDSAGALLAVSVALLSVSPAMREVFGVDPLATKICALGLVSGMFNLFGSYMFRYYSKILLEENYKQSVYFPFFDYKNLQDLQNLPPALIISSKEDMISGMSQWFDKILTAWHAPHEFYFANRCRKHRLCHVFSILHPDYPESKTATTKLLDFFLKKV